MSLKQYSIVSVTLGLKAPYSQLWRMKATPWSGGIVKVPALGSFRNRFLRLRRMLSYGCSSRNSRERNSQKPWSSEWRQSIHWRSLGIISDGELPDFAIKEENRLMLTWNTAYASSLSTLRSGPLQVHIGVSCLGRLSPYWGCIDVGTVECLHCDDMARRQCKRLGLDDVLVKALSGMAYVV